MLHLSQLGQSVVNIACRTLEGKCPEPAPGDVPTAGGDPSKVGIPAGYRWGYILTPDGDDATVVTEVFDCGPEENRQHLLREGGGWINGTNSVLESMTSSLERLEKISTE
jgi:hypothetical protein